MALSRIWSAFIIVALLVATGQFIFNSSRDDVFGRMVSGTSKDEFKYVVAGDSVVTKTEAVVAFEKEMKPYAYKRQEKIDEETKYIINDESNAATSRLANEWQLEYPAVRIVSYDYIRGRKQKPVDGVIATCKVAVEICLGLIGIMALFMGFLNIAERAGGIRFLSRIVWPFFFQIVSRHSQEPPGKWAYYDEL